VPVLLRSRGWKCRGGLGTPRLGVTHRQAPALAGVGRVCGIAHPRVGVWSLSQHLCGMEGLMRVRLSGSGLRLSPSGPCPGWFSSLNLQETGQKLGWGKPAGV